MTPAMRVNNNNNIYLSCFINGLRILEKNINIFLRDGVKNT